MPNAKISSVSRQVVGGVDTHKDLHVAAVVDEQDRILASESFATTRQGYKQMLTWMRSFGEVVRVGIECTGTYGAGLLRYLEQAGITVLEVTAPDKSDRRKRGKDDTLDAGNAAHAAFAGVRTVTPKKRDGMVESLRVLKVCRKTAIQARRVTLQLIQNTIVSAPDDLRESLRTLTRMQLIRTLAAWRPDLSSYRQVTSAYRIALKSLGRRYLELHDEIADLDVMIAALVDDLAPELVARNARIALKSLGRRYLELHDEIADLDVMIAALVDDLAPELVARNAIGYESAAQLLLTAGDNSDRFRSESSFAALCGVSPVQASSGKVTRHRLNRGGDRAANSALHIIARL